jgi:DNA polymerase III alpha subunit (gram-positive type)
MNEELLRFNKKQKYLVFDFETCNLNLASPQNKPWQLAFLVIENDRVKERCDYWIKWNDLKMSDGARRVTGWTEKAYNSKAVDPIAPLKHFERYLYDDSYIKVGHNILGFDVYIHNIYRRLCGKKADYSYIPYCIDTLCLAKGIKKNIKFQRGDNFTAWQYKLNGFFERKLRASLTQCCKDYQIDFDPKKLHNALYDIEKNYAVFQKMIWEIEV